MVIHGFDPLYRSSLLSVVATVIAMLAPHAWAQTCNTEFVAGTDTNTIQTKLNNSDTYGPVYCFDSGTYRLTTALSPTGRTDHATVILETTPGMSPAVLDGSVPLTDNTDNDHFALDGHGNWVITLTDQTNVFVGIPILPINTVPCQDYNDSSGSRMLDVNCQYADSIFVTSSSGIIMPRRYLVAAYNDTIPPLPTASQCDLCTGSYAVVYSSFSQGTPAKLYLSSDLLSNCTAGPPYHCDQTVDIAFSPGIIANANSANNVKVTNLILQKSGNQSQVGAINAPGSTGWIVTATEVRDHHGAGIILDGTIGGPNRAANCGSSTSASWTCCDPTTGVCTLSSLNDSNYIHHNGQIGVEGSCKGLGASAPFYNNPTTCVPWDSNNGQGTTSAGDTVENNIIENNNWLFFDATDAAGGAKFAGMWKLQFLYNYVFGNYGPGAWCDINCDGTNLNNQAISNVNISYNYLAKNVLPQTHTCVSNGMPAPCPNGIGGGAVYEISHNAKIQGNTTIYNDTTHCEEYKTPDNELLCPLNGFNMGGIVNLESSQVTVGGDAAVRNTVTGYNGIGFVMNLRKDFCGGGPPPTRTTFLDGSPYCPSTDSSGHPIHDIRDKETFDTSQHQCTGYSMNSGTLRNCNVVTTNMITECEANTDTKGRLAGLDNLDNLLGTIDYYFTATDYVYDHNTYYAPGGNNGTYFTPSCTLGQSCALDTFQEWQAHSNQDSNSGGVMTVTSTCDH
jgi:hypothetical protein